MIWQSTSLIDGPLSAHFNEDTHTLTVGSEALEFTSTDPADLCAVDTAGRTYRLVKRSITVARYEAVCAGRHYSARRAGGFIERRREITDEAGRLVAVAVGKLNGDLELRLADAEAPFLDVAFISWALTYIDTPTRRTLY